MAKVMKSAWDESAQLANETLSSHSILGDDYVTQDNDALDNMRDDLNQGLDDDDDVLEADDEEKGPCDCNC